MNDMFVRWMLLVRQSRQAGQGLVEYSLIIALVSVFLIAALNLLALDIEAVFTAIGAALAAA